jgi:MFS family permease
MNEENSLQVQKDASSRVIVQLTLALIVFSLTFMSQALNVALPKIGLEFGAEPVILNWMVLAFVLALATFSVPFGRIGDVFGIKKTLITGIIFFVVISGVAAFSVSSSMLIVCRALQGISAAMAYVNTLALLTAIFPVEERGRVFGINVAAVYIGSSMGPFLGGLLTEFLGWRSIFLLVVPVGLLIISLLLFKVKGEWCVCKGQRIDYVGAVIFGLALISLMYGSSLLPSISSALLICAGTIGLIIFLRWENRVESPLFNVNIFRNNRIFIFSNIASLINYSAVFGVAFLLSLYLQYNKGLSADQAGMIMIAHPVIQAILSPFTGRLSDKIEPRIVASIGMALTFCALLSFVFLTNGTSLWQIVAALVLIGTGFALFLSPNSNALMSSVLPGNYGVASAVMSTMISMGQTLSIGISMVVMNLVIGRVTITSEYYPAFLTSAKIAFSIFALLAFGGVFISLFRGKMRRS